MTGGEAIRAAVGAAVGPSHGAITGWSGPDSRPWSWHFAVRTEGGALVVKVPRWEGIASLEAALAAGPQADTAAEFAALRSIEQMVATSGDAGLAAVVPVAYVSAVNAIVMERLEAASLRSRLGIGAPNQAEEWFGSLGRWLGHYHRTGAATDTAFAVVAELERWEGASRLHHGLRDEVAQARAAARRLEGRIVVTGAQHGDLTLGNVLITADGRVAVIDPNWTTGRHEVDAARILTEALLGRSQLLTFGLRRGTAVVDRWERALVAGHGRLDPAVLAYDRGAEALDRRIALTAGGLMTRSIGRGAGPRFRGEIRRRFAAG